MADEVNSAAAQPSSPEQTQCDRVAHLAKRLHGAANSVARALQPIVYLRSDPKVTGELVQTAYALSAGLSALIEDLMLESVSTGGSQSKDTWSKEHLESLLTSMEQCHDFFTDICHHVRIADERHQVKGLVAGEKYIDQIDFNNESEVLEETKRCFLLVSQTRLIVKHTCLTRFVNLNDGEVQEALRLTAALQSPDFDSIWILKDEVFASSRVRAALGQTQPEAASSNNLPGVRMLSSPQDLMSSNHMDSMWAHGNWEPMGSPRSPTNAVPTTAGQDSANNTSIASPPIASASIQEPNLDESNIPFAPSDLRSKGAPGTVTFGEPSVIKRLLASGPITESTAHNASFANWKPTNLNAFKPIPHLEAYIIRPLVESKDIVSTLSHKVESLRLSEAVLRAQVESFDQTYTIMDALLDLQPQVLNLIQSRAAQRQGNIVSVKYGKSVDVSTSIGSLQIKPTVFIISTTTMLPQDSTPVPIQLPNPADSAFRPAAGGGLFDKIRPTPGFGSSINNIADHHLASPEAYSTYLEEQGEPCTWVERSEGRGLQHYQTITANKKWHSQDRSFEEIRLADYDAGRRISVKNSTTSYPWSSFPTFGVIKSDGFYRPAFPATPESSKTGVLPKVTPASTLGPTHSGVFHSNTRQSGSLAPDLQAKQPSPGPWTSKSSPQQTSNNEWTSQISSQRPLSKSIFNSAIDARRPEPVKATFPSTSPRDSVNGAPKPTSEPVKDNQGFCTKFHVHGPFCRLPPSQDIQSPPTENTAFSGGRFSANTTVSPFGTLTSDPKNRPFAAALLTKEPVTFPNTTSKAANKAPKWTSISPSTSLLGRTSSDKATSTTANPSIPAVVQQSAFSGPTSNLVPPASRSPLSEGSGAHNLGYQGASALQAVDRQSKDSEARKKAASQEGKNYASSIDAKDPAAAISVGVRNLLRSEQAPTYDKAVGTVADSVDNERSISNSVLFIGYLPFDCTEDTIQKAFQEYGSVTSISLPTDNTTGMQKGFAYVEFSSVEEATAAVEASRAVEIDGRRIRVDFAARRNHFGP